MISLLSIVALGFFLGMRHATDADHVIAVSTIVSREANIKRAALVGTFWGFGHTFTIFVIGSLIILFNVVIPPRLVLAMELAVGIMLMVLGFANIRGFARSMPSEQRDPKSDVVHSHAHSHGDYVHSHSHGHSPDVHPHAHDHTPVNWMDEKFGRRHLYQHLRPLAIGIVHGLAGSAAVALLVLTTIRDPGWAIAYLLVFGIGTIGGMVLITMALASSLRLVGRTQVFFRRLGLASGALSLIFGGFWAYQICIRSGLLTSTPHWTPR